jgi:hypothetical protein
VSYYPGIFLEGLRETKINLRIVGVPAEIRKGSIIENAIILSAITP